MSGNGPIDPPHSITDWQARLEKTMSKIEVRTTYPFDGSFYRDDAAAHAAGVFSDHSPILR